MDGSVEDGRRFGITWMEISMACFSGGFRCSFCFVYRYPLFFLILFLFWLCFGILPKFNDKVSGSLPTYLTKGTHIHSIPLKYLTLPPHHTHHTTHVLVLYPEKNRNKHDSAHKDKDKVPEFTRERALLCRILLYFN